MAGKQKRSFRPQVEQLEDRTLLSAGALDPTFDGDGKLTTRIGSGYAYARSIALQPDGKIVVAGESYNGSNYDFALARYNPDGSLDTTFDGDGKVTTSLGPWDDKATSVALQPDGKIVVAGYSRQTSNRFDFTLARYNPDGSLDSTFHGDGKLFTLFWGASQSFAQSVAIQSDGKIVVAGIADMVISYDFALARFNPDGSLDTSFDGDGTLTTPIGPGNDVAYSIALQPDGKIVVAGYSAIGTTYDVALARYNADGSLDTTFDGDGKLLTTFSGSGGDYAQSTALQPDGKILVAGYSYIEQYAGGYADFALARVNPDGSLDTTFDGDGKLTTPIGSVNDLAYSIALQPDGKIVVAGTAGNPLIESGPYDFALARYNPDGSLDTTFDGDGKLTTPIGSADDMAYSMALQPDGKIVVAGYSSGDFALARYDGDPGSPPSATASIRGQKFHDLDGDGQRDDGEPGLDGWTIELRDGVGNVVATTTTMSRDLNGDGSIDPRTEQGLYWFTDLAPGKYTAAEVPQADWEQTFPERSFSLAATQNTPFAAPTSIASGDFDHDGDLDLAIGSGYWSTLSVWLNNGDGTFAPGVDYNANGGFLRAADVDGDGHLDLAAAPLGSPAERVWILFGNGDGTFAAPTEVLVGSAGQGSAGNQTMALGDLDGDGDIDIAMVDQRTRTIALMFNRGNRTFAARVDVPEGGNPISITASDLDGDGDVDLAVTDLTFPAGKVSVLLNEGAGVFTSPVSYTVGSGWPLSIVATDLDGDGDQDLTGVSYTDDTVWVLVNDGRGTFTLGPTALTGDGPNSLTAGDLDGDGDLDLVVASPALSGPLTGRPTQVVSVLFNQGNGTFAPPVYYGTGDAPYSVALGDLDRDGNLDLVVANNGRGGIPGGVSILRNEGQGRFPAARAFEAGIPFPTTIVAGDLDRDGNVDLVATRPGADPQFGYVSILRNQGDQTFAAVRVLHATGTWASLADLDGDGDLDLAVANAGSDDVSVFLNSGTGSFAATVNFVVGDQPQFVTAADLDGDGDVDLVTANSASGDVSVLLNNGDGAFAAARNYAAGYTMGDIGPSVAVGDLDGDGDRDLVVTNHFSAFIAVFLNRGDGTFAPAIRYTVPFGQSSIMLGDLDGDGDLDVLQSGLAPVALFNRGDATFGEPVQAWPGLNLVWALADVDDDGDLDLIGLTSSFVSDANKLSVALNQGDGTFATPLTFSGGTWPTAATASDLDGDGDLDLALASVDSNAVSVVWNTSTKPTYTVTLSPGQSVAGLDFGNAGTLTPQTGRIVGIKFEDRDGDGQFNLGEPGLAGVTIFLDADNDGQLDPGERSTSTASGNAIVCQAIGCPPVPGVAGYYTFDDLAPATYVVRELVPDRFRQTAPAVGFYTVVVVPGEVTIVPPFGNTATEPENEPPQLDPINDQVVDEGLLLEFTAVAIDPDAQAGSLLHFSLDPGAPAGAAIDPLTGDFTWTPAEDQGPGSYEVTVRVTDEGSPTLSDWKTFSVNVAEVNAPPVLGTIGSKSVAEGNLLTFTATATDPDLPANTLTFSLGPGAPAGAAIDSVTGVFSWRPGADQVGVHSVTVWVTDSSLPGILPGDWDSDSETFNITVTHVVSATAKDTSGLYDPARGTFYLRNANTTGPADTTFAVGRYPASWLPIAGDWDGDGTTTVGLYHKSKGNFYLWNGNAAGAPDARFIFRPNKKASYTPVVGDWNGDGVTTVGLYDPSKGTFALRNSNSAGVADVTFRYGPKSSKQIPLAGDWNADGTATVGLYDRSKGTFSLRNANAAGAADVIFAYGPKKSSSTPLAGDWNSDGTTTVGLYDAPSRRFNLRNSNTSGPADLRLQFAGASPSWKPIAGNWDAVVEATSGLITAASGGTLTLPSGSSVTIPAGVLPSDQNVTLSLLSALPKQPSTGILRGVGPALRLSFSSTTTTRSSSATGAQVAVAQQSFSSSLASSSSGDIQFTVDLSKSTARGLDGSVPIGYIESPGADTQHFGLEGSYDSSNKRATFTVPFRTFSDTSEGKAINAGLANVNLSIKPATMGGRRWDGSKWVDMVSLPPLNLTTKTLVLVHGMLGSVEGAFGKCTKEIARALGYDQVVGFNYDWTQPLEKSAGQLADFVKQTGLKNIVFDAHSQGAPVAVFASSLLDATVQIPKIISLGGALNGSPLAAAAWSLVTVLFNLPGGSLPATTAATLLAGGFAADLVPNSDFLKRMASEFNSNRAALGTKIFTVAGTRPILGTELFRGLFGSEPYDGLIGLFGAHGKGTALDTNNQITQVGTFDLSHIELECANEVIESLRGKVDPPTIGVNPPRLDFPADEGGPNPQPKPLTVTNTGQGSVLSYGVSDDATWLLVSPPSPIPLKPLASDTLQVSANASRLSPGIYQANITISDSAATNDPVLVPVTLVVSRGLPAGVTITQSGGSTNVTEGGATDTYTVVLTSQPTANVTITVSPDSQLTVSSTTLPLVFTRTNWDAAQTVTVTAVDDSAVEGPHTGTISHSASSSDTNYNGIAIAGVTANITENDTAGVTITESGGSTNVTEGGATDSYSVVLTSEPTADVTISVSPDSQLTVSSASLVFTSANWNTAQTVTVTAVNDKIAEGDHTGTITHSASSSDSQYNGIAITSVTANITDNDEVTLYDVIDLGANFVPTDVNVSDQVVGEYYFSFFDTIGALWQRDATTGTPSLVGFQGTQTVEAINDQGTIAGILSETETQPKRAFRGTVDGAVSPLPSLPVIENHDGWYDDSLTHWSFGYGINARGDIVGQSAHEAETPGHPMDTDHAALWTSGGVTNLGSLVRDWPAHCYRTNDTGAAYDINDLGQVVGEGDLLAAGSCLPGPSHAALWETTGEPIDLGTLGGRSSTAKAINNNGWVVGISHTDTASSTSEHAFVWRDGVMSDLGTFGGTESWALDVNNSDQIVGFAYYADQKIASALWETDPASGNQRIIDLNERLLPNLRSEWYVTEAHAINDLGHIAALAARKLGDGSTEMHGVLLRPSTTSSHALMLAEPALSTVVESSPESTTAPVVTREQVDPVIHAALTRWIGVGCSVCTGESFSELRFEIRDLPDDLLGFTQRGVIYLDRDAAGYGWFIDPTPSQDEEFHLLAENQVLTADPDSPAFGKVDLLTVIAHELGHLLGLDDLDPFGHPSDVMSGTLALGQRRLPSLAAVDALFALEP